MEENDIAKFRARAVSFFEQILINEGIYLLRLWNWRFLFRKYLKIRYPLSRILIGMRLIRKNP